ncbi:MAG TPA: transferrin-binding protein-like solute binding protein [Burkholderiales bacterium]|nr:transferrin-binding protein-like solute binding protein [Burkholderiales bacterium]
MRALPPIVLTVAVAAACLVTACNGGGVNNGVVPVPFTSFSAVKSGQPVQANGISQTVSATVNGLGVVTATNVNAVDTANSMAQVTYGSIPAMSQFSFTTPSSSVSFSTTNVQCPAGTGTCTGSNSTSTATVMNPLTPPTPAWNYQSFGYWLVITSGTTRMAGAMSFGSPTALVSIPAGGTATYSGLSQGTYIDQNGVVWTESATLNSTANFNLGTRSVSFATTGTQISNPNPVLGTQNAPELNLTGNLAISGNQFTGVVTAPGGGASGASPMSGGAVGQFYGPNVLEIGGVYSLKGAGVQTMVGGFGAKQP